MKSLIVIFCILFAGAYASPLEQYLTSAGGRIIGGVETTPFQYPFQCSLQQIDDGGFYHICGATILDENWLLTAAHCVEDESTYQVWCGKWDLTVAEPGEQIIEAKRVVIHTNFTTISYPLNVPWDIALVELDTPLVFTDTVQPIQLPPPDYNPPTNNATLIGWGKYQLLRPGISNRLRHVHVSLMTPGECNTALILIGSPEHLLCTDPTLSGKGGCNGDAGGAMVQQSGSTLYQTGIASWIPSSCGVPLLSITGYLKTYLFLDWIIEHKVSSY